MTDTTFSKLSDDVALKIFSTLEDDPRDWARLSCVCRKFTSLITTVCYKSKCISSFPVISAAFPGEWGSLHKLAVCCPGLLHSGVLLDNSDFGLHRELGSDNEYHCISAPEPPPASAVTTMVTAEAESFGGWSLYDDLYFDTIYNTEEYPLNDCSALAQTDVDVVPSMGARAGVVPSSIINNDIDYNNIIYDTEYVVANETCNKKRKVSSPVRPLHNVMQRSHLATGTRSLSREQGNKLLASRFRGDSLYLCDWPGCVHIEKKRKYMLFRGFFNNFKRSKVWRAINDANRSKIDIRCAFCSCNETWDLNSSFCLKRGFGFHDDGEPVVRAYVCENGHVSGAWTDLPVYS